MIKIVLVENKATAIEDIKKMISTIPFAQLTGCYLSPEEAIHYALHDRPDILVTEISLSGYYGLATAKSFLSNLPELKVVLLYRDGRSAKETLEVGACDYIVKPLSREKLMKTLLKVR